MAVRIALLLTFLVLPDGIARGQSILVCESAGRGFRPDAARFSTDSEHLLVVGALTGDAAGDMPRFRDWDVHARDFVAEHRLDGRGSLAGLDVA